MKTQLFAILGAGTVVAGAAAQDADALSDVTVLAERLAGSVADTPGWTLAEWDREEISKEAPRTLDELLAQEPSFSLYRRQTSLFGNPTSAGVSLRNTGATAASRTLVLLDGIPQNDPFGGWVYWARYEPSTLESVRIVPAAQSAVWGNQSPAGVVQMESQSPFTERHLLRMGGGSQGTISGATTHTLVADDGSLGVTFSTFGLHSDGFFAVPPWQRGTIDRRLELDAYGADLKMAWKAFQGVTIEPMFSWYEEDRGNGTPLAENATEALDFALRVTAAEEGGFSWQALAYHQRRRFEAMFTSVNAARTAENPSLDQFHVPGNGTGGALTFRYAPEGPWSLTAGADLRQIEGSTNENASFIAGRFTRRREAGGEQGNAGIFVAGGYEAQSKTRIDASLRLDAWWLDNGSRLERSLVTGKPLRVNFQEDRDGVEPSFSLAVNHPLTEDLHIGASAGTSFRLPTLNELHRPFRVRSDITEANPALDPERFYSVEGTLDWQAADCLSFEAAVFHHWIRDAIANVPITDPAQIAAIFGTIPPGGSGQQRQNVDEARVFGIEAGTKWEPMNSITLHFDGIWSETEFADSPKQPLLEGKPFPQAPDLRLIASADWHATDRLTFSAGYEYGSHQFDDALAARRIPSYSSVKVGASWQAKDNLLLTARVDNLFDEEIATGLSTDGIRTIAGPRSLWIGAEWGF
ncbi:TonB-dependent receptor [Haloferula sp. BvORR071]|uniref:TonB-dependent receptor n=1 Tax=Haloferula sp. BvORR071 TaxID=1396141 RepID=UPI00054CDB69|nr:TonB-dependent receptor [Haloferula sp. BvORR071]